MTRWLVAARTASPPAAKSDNTDKTQPQLANVTPESTPNPVLSDLSVLSGRGKALGAKPDTSPRAAMIRALRSGLKTPGSIATATKLGASDTYQELDRMTLEGLVTMQPNGALGLTPAADLEAAQ